MNARIVAFLAELSRVGVKRSDREIGNHLGCSTSRVRRVRSQMAKGGAR